MPPDGNTVLRMLRNNRGLKLAALLVAVVVWYSIREITSFEGTLPGVQLDVRLDDGWAVLDRSVDEVDVVFRGSPSDVQNLSREQVRVEVDLRGESVAGSRDVRLLPSNVRSHGGARAVALEPAEVTLTLDREGAREVPVQADIVGSPPLGFEVEQVVCTPSNLVVEGPAGRLAGIEQLRTAQIDLEGRLRSFSLTRAVVSPSDTWSARINPDRVKIDVTIVERATRKEIEGVRVQLVVRPETPPIRLASTNRVRLVVQGRSDVLATISATNLTAFLDCSAVGPGESLEVGLYAPAPAGVQVVSVEPPALRVEMSGP